MKPTYNQTLPFHLIQNHSVSYAVSYYWMKEFAKTGYELEVFYPNFVIDNIPSCKVKWISSSNPFYDFTVYHNKINKKRYPKPNCISRSSDISVLASIGNEGMRYAKKGKNIIGLIHVGNVVIGERAVIGSYSSIAKAVFSSTVIEEDTKIGCGVQIGHNCNIGKRNIIVDGTVILGSVRVGNDCFIGGNSVLRNGISIADNTFIGMGSVVTHSISDSGGIWIGNPAKFHRKWNGEF